METGACHPLVRRGTSSTCRPSPAASPSPTSTKRSISLLRQSEVERRAFAERGFHPDAAFVAGYDLAADRQAHAVAGRLVARLEHAEDAEDLLRVLRLDADAVVLHGDQPLAAL